MAAAPNVYRQTNSPVRAFIAKTEPSAPPLEGLATMEPAFGASAVWIVPGLQEQALANGYAVVEQTSVLATHLAEVIRQFAHELDFPGIFVRSQFVPDEILNRRKKATASQGPPKVNATQWPRVAEIGQHMISSSSGITVLNRFLEALQKAQHNEEIPLDSVARTLTLESWLRQLVRHGILTNSLSKKEWERSRHLERSEGSVLATPEHTELQARSRPKSLAS